MQDLSHDLARFLEQLNFAPLAIIRESESNLPPNPQPSATKASPTAGSHEPARKRPGNGGGREAATAERDRKLYDDWKAANAATGITKAEFLREGVCPMLT